MVRLISNIDTTDFVEYYNDNILNEDKINNWNSLPREAKFVLFLQSLTRSSQKQVDWIINPRDLKEIKINSSEFGEIYSLFQADIIDFYNSIPKRDQNEMNALLNKAGIKAIGRNINLF